MTPRLEIEYCAQCRWLLRAAWMAQELLTTFENGIGEVALIPGGGWIFEVRLKPSKISPFTEYLKKRWLEGCYDARQLYREIILLGYEGHLNVLQAYLEPWRKLLPEEICRKQEIPAVSPPAPRAVVWWLLKDKEKLKEEQRAFIGELLEKSPIIKAAYELILEFRRMIKNRDGKTLKDWFGKVEQSGISELARFANGLREDEAAVQAGMEYEWSNGQVEGQVNRLKMVKRQMFGRANLDLLKARVLNAA